MNDMSILLNLLKLNRNLDDMRVGRKRDQDAALAVIDVALDALRDISLGAMTGGEAAAVSRVALHKMKSLVKAYGSEC